MKRRKKRKNKDLVKGWKGWKARMERFDRIKALAASHSYTQIGKIEGITKQRVHQILNNCPKREQLAVI